MDQDQHAASLDQPDLERLVTRFRAPGVAALVLFGSHARGDAGPFSDVDLVRFHAQGAHSSRAETYLMDQRFVVVSDVYPDLVEAYFREPEQVSTAIVGLRCARPLWDPDGYFSVIQGRANAFDWDSAMQTRADAWASSQMVGWIEEVQKGLAGLKTGHEGRLLNARFGLSWGMVNVMRVQRGVLVSGDNGVFGEVIQEMGGGSRWAVLCRQAYGTDAAHPLIGQVQAGLRLYAHTAELLSEILRPDDKRLVDEVVRRIMIELR